MEQLLEASEAFETVNNLRAGFGFKPISFLTWQEWQREGKISPDCYVKITGSGPTGNRYFYKTRELTNWVAEKWQPQPVTD